MERVLRGGQIPLGGKAISFRRNGMCRDLKALTMLRGMAGAGTGPERRVGQPCWWQYSIPRQGKPPERVGKPM